MATACDSKGAVLAVGDEIAPRGCPELSHQVARINENGGVWLRHSPEDFGFGFHPIELLLMHMVKQPDAEKKP